VREIERYMHRVSGPLLERIDIHIEMAPVSFHDMTLLRPAEDSLALRERVAVAWERQRVRFAGHPRVLFNAQMALGEIREHCRLGAQPLGLLRMAVQKLGLSPRAYHKALRLARTIADLAGAEAIGEAHVAEAIAYRVLDRRGEGEW
jgi:magnesium chelatase family protein